MTKNSTVSKVLEKEYKYGFLTQIESEKIPKGINEDIIRLISEKKKEPEEKKKKKPKKKTNEDIVKKLKDLNELYESGVLTKEEFEKAKNKLLD